ncbi:MAG TPA: histidine phosphatase family protein [Gemmatimonadota bacterium]|nr:histidine phosphatase family protein [Gemmatimonadota bacterium]
MRRTKSPPSLVRPALLLALLSALVLPRPALARQAGSGSPAPPPGASGDSVVVFVVRHAEKVEDGSEDPDLTAAGRERADRLARILADAGLTTIYSTDYRRTRETAQAAAEAAGMGVHLYDFATQERLAGELRRTPGRYLVVGHSNTVPGFVRALGGDPGTDDARYDDLFEVLIGPGGATTVHLHYGAKVAAGMMEGR